MTTEQERRELETRRQLAAELRLIAYEAEAAGELSYAMRARALADGSRAGNEAAMTQGCELLITAGEV